MATYTVYYDIQVTDAFGDTANVRLQTTTVDTATIAARVTDAQTLASDIAACTNGKVTSIGFSVLVSKAQISAGTAPPPANATYPSVTDGARLSFANSAGERRSITIPAPLLSDFKTNSNTVNPDDANVSALISQVEAFFDLDGATNLYEGGVKVSHHARRRPARKSL